MNPGDHRIESPYVGPRPFKREDVDRFFGRSQETSEIVSLIIANPEVLIYAASGAGKTSLLNAAVIPSLESAPCEVFPPVRLRSLVQSNLESIPNIFVFHALMNWAAFHDDKSGEFHLARNSIPEFMQSRSRPTGDYGSPVRRVIIFDQFEEFFSSYPDRWRDRRDFFGQLHAALEDDPYLRLVLVMREEFIAALDPFAHLLPDRLRTRFRLDLLREENALAAIELPFLATGRHFANGVAERLVKGLMEVQVETASGQTETIMGEFVEPVQLQVVCEGVWRHLKPEDTEITLAHLETISMEEALLSFYEESIQTVAQKTHISEPVLRSWFEKHLVTPAGTRGMVFRGETETEGLRNDAVDELDKLHLIRGELRGGSQWYELTHDRFIDSVRRSHEKLLSNLEAGAAEVGQTLEKQAAAWDSSGRSKAGLLAENELREAEAFLRSPAASMLGVSNAVRTLVMSSRANVDEARVRSIGLRMLYLGIGIGILIFAIFMIIFRMISRGW